MLELRDRTEGEIREKMGRKEYEPEEIEKAVDFLKDKDFINDERFVKGYVENKQSFGTTGKYKIRQKLMLLHLDSGLIEENLAEINPETEYDQAIKLAKNYLAHREVPKEKLYEKVGRHLVSKGYEYDTVKKVLDGLLK